MMFAKPWTKLHGLTEEEIKTKGGPSPGMFIAVFLCGLISSLIMALLFHIFRVHDIPGGIHVAALFWLGFTGPAMFANALFSFRPWKLWLIDASYYLVAYIIVGAMHATWQ